MTGFNEIAKLKKIWREAFYAGNESEWNAMLFISFG